MATTVYDIKRITFLDGTVVECTPLKIKYLREFMDVFYLVKDSKNDEEAIGFLSLCAAVAMQQYYPPMSDISALEDNADLPTIYKILDIAAGIKINSDSDKEVKEQATESGTSWESLKLADLESEIFLLGIWKDFKELEESLSMPELLAILSFKRELDYEEKKFLAAIQGVDIDKNKKKDADAWEKMKAKVFSGGQSSDPNDILALQGKNAQMAGFGLGMGINYKRIDKKQ
jgi:hypothetical protein